MALVVKDRVKETTTTTGTGTITLAGAVSGFQSFSVIGNGNTTYYTIQDPTAGTWEVGIGTYTSSGTTLSRDSVLESSNSGNLVNFGAGDKDVFVTYPAERSVYVDGSSITPGATARLGFANLAQGSALSVLGVTGNATADNASIAAGTDHQVLRRSGTSVGFGAIALNQSNAITGTLPIANGGTGSTSTTFVNLASNVTGTLPIANGGTGSTSTTFVNLASNVTGTLPIANGGTGLTATPTNGQVDIGNGTGFTRTTLTAGTGISITNGAGSISIAATNNGTVTSVGGTGTVNGVTLSGTVTSSGNITLGGAINASTISTGTLPVANGGTGQTTYTNGQLLIGNTTGGTLAKATLTASTGISITNGAGSITIAATNNGTVTSVGGTGTVNGISLSGTVTSSGNLSLSGSVSIAGSQVTSGDIAAARITSALNAGGSAPIYACRAWVNFNGTGTPAIRASGNVSSITDNGTGDYTVNFTTAMPDANYGIAFSGDVNTGVSANDVRAVNFGAPAAGSLRIYTGDNYTSPVGEDWALICLSIFR